MKIAAWMIVLAALIQVPATAGNKDDAAACEKAKQKIRQIEAKMRIGYSAAQGIRYEEQLRKLRKKRYEYCR